MTRAAVFETAGQVIVSTILVLVVLLVLVAVVTAVTDVREAKHRRAGTPTRTLWRDLAHLFRKVFR